MRLLRGPYFMVACIVAVAAGAAAGAGWLQKAWLAVEPAYDHPRAGVTSDVEAIFRRMDGALLKAFASHYPVCTGPGGSCTGKSEGHAHFMSTRRAGNFRLIGFIVGGQTGTAAEFELRIDFESADGRMTFTDQERQSVLQIARDYGFNESQHPAVLAACQEGPIKIATEKTVAAAGISLICRVLPNRRAIRMRFKGPVPRAFAARG
jgi:hypothetical protein